MTHAPAPPGLLVIEDFCNTAALLRGTDELRSVAEAQEWLRRRGWDPIEGELDLETLRDEREAIRAYLVDRSDAGVRRRLNRLVVRHLRGPYVDSEGRLAFEPADGPSSPTGAALSALLLHGLSSTGRRLKACAAPDCHYVFYDHSRSRTGTWCDMNVCGARHKMRDYRRRRGAARHEGG
jgi:predicted RNA-binding Zn ribbon-like protein